MNGYKRIDKIMVRNILGHQQLLTHINCYDQMTVLIMISMIITRMRFDFHIFIYALLVDKQWNFVMSMILYDLMNRCLIIHKKIKDTNKTL